MRKITLIFALVITALTAMGQAPYNLNYPRINMGLNPSSLVDIKGQLSLHNVLAGGSGDSVAVFQGGKLMKVPRSQFAPSAVNGYVELSPSSAQSGNIWINGEGNFFGLRNRNSLILDNTANNTQNILYRNLLSSYDILNYNSTSRVLSWKGAQLATVEDIRDSISNVVRLGSNVGDASLTGAFTANQYYTSTGNFIGNRLFQSGGNDDGLAFGQYWGDKIIIRNEGSAYGTTLRFSNNVGSGKDITFQDASGTVALVNDLSGFVKKSGDTMTGDLLLASATPTNALSAVPKSYIDNALTGITWKNSARVATIVNIALTGLGTIDGVSLVSGNRVLVKNQTDQTQNGIYIASSGVWVRSDDADSADELNSATVAVMNGTTQRNTQWTSTSTITTVGSDPITFGQISGAGTYSAGSNLTLSGNAFSVVSNPTFSGNVTAPTFIGNLTGTADAVANGLYSNINYSNPVWLSSLAYTKLTGGTFTLTNGTATANFAVNSSGAVTINPSGNQVNISGFINLSATVGKIGLGGSTGLAGQAIKNNSANTALEFYDPLFVSASTTVPTPTSTGVKGEVRYIGSFKYECIATNTWVRVAITTTW